MPSPTPQASLERGSLLPLSIRPGRPCRLAQAARRGIPAEARGASANRGLSAESGSKLPQSKAASPRWRGRSIQSGWAVLLLLRRRRRPWSAGACSRFRSARDAHAGWRSRRAEASPPKPGEHPQTEASPQKAAASCRSPKRLRRGGGAGQSRAAGPSCCSSDAAGVLGARELASAFDPPGTPMPAGAAGAPRHPRRSPGSIRKPRPLRRKRQQAAAVQSGFAAVAGQVNPERLGRPAAPPTPQASLERGSLLPLSIRPGRPCRLAQPARRGIPAEARGASANRGLSAESGSKLPQSKAASPRWRGRSIQSGWAVLLLQSGCAANSKPGTRNSKLSAHSYAGIPVMLWPRISVWMSWVPS